MTWRMKKWSNIPHPHLMLGMSLLFILICRSAQATASLYYRGFETTWQALEPQYRPKCLHTAWDVWFKHGGVHMSSLVDHANIDRRPNYRLTAPQQVGTS